MSPEDIQIRRVLGEWCCEGLDLTDGGRRWLRCTVLEWPMTQMADGHLDPVSNGSWWTFENSDVIWSQNVHPGLYIKS